jgi:hypothetical protein
LRSSEERKESHGVAVKIVDKINGGRIASSDREMQRAVSKEIEIWRAIGSDDNCVRFREAFF